MPLPSNSEYERMLHGVVDDFRSSEGFRAVPVLGPACIASVTAAVRRA